MAEPSIKPWPKWRQDLHDVIFEADTKAGKAFDVILLALIVLSIIAVMLESVEWFNRRYYVEIIRLEWIFTILFTIEYVARIISVRRPIKYITSFYGIIDLLSILPTFMALLFDGGGQSFAVIRALRLLRIFRIFKLARYTREASLIGKALVNSRYKIFIFMLTMLTIVTIIGSLMYLVEGSESGFDSIPKSIYWAIVTLTTVGYGDITPQTPLGQFLAAMIMFIGYTIIAVPTGIVSAEIASTAREDLERATPRTCPHCMKEGHAEDAKFCRNCGGEMRV
ncbi:MAG: ion transporter [Saprospiraceae bacterium]|nr:ion transporter [Saprospiraceae bacterium]